MFLAFLTACAGKKRVESETYDLLLRTVLSHDVNEITVDSLHKIKDDVVLLDARQAREYNVSHIAHARWIGYDNFDSTAVKEFSKHTPIVVYCAVGYRSEKIVQKLDRMGFTNVSNLYGGIFEWKNEGHTVVNAAGPTDSVHAYTHIWGVWLNKGKKVYD